MKTENTARRILVVDDEQTSIKLLESALQEAGFEVITAANGLEAMRHVKVHTPDLIIMDWMMPKMDGSRACALLKSDKRYAKIPLIMITAMAESSAQGLSVNVGADAFLNKPLIMPELIKKIRELFAR